MMTTHNNSALYIGVTSNLDKRVMEHREHLFTGSFTDKYGCDKLVYYEKFSDIRLAIEREKQLKKWRREWKNKLVDDMNPEWRDLMG